MSDAENPPPAPTYPLRQRLIALGGALIAAAALGAAIAGAGPSGGWLSAALGPIVNPLPTDTLAPTITPSATPLPYTPAAATVTPAGQALVQREALPPATPTPTPTLTPLPTDTPLPTETATATPGQPAEVTFTQAERNALSWLCYGEVGGMGTTKVDACLSVISTVRARYAYSNSFGETGVIDTITRPGQFNVSIDTGRPSPDADLNWAVEAYEGGMRGSCNGYLYFNAVQGRDCAIFGYGGQVLYFFNHW